MSEHPISAHSTMRVAVAVSLVHSAKMNGHDPYVYLKDVLARLPTHPARDIDDLLPHRWAPPIIG